MSPGASTNACSSNGVTSFVSGGLSRSVCGPADWEEYTQWQWMTVQDNAPSYPF